MWGDGRCSPRWSCRWRGGWSRTPCQGKRSRAGRLVRCREPGEPGTAASQLPCSATCSHVSRTPWRFRALQHLPLLYPSLIHLDPLLHCLSSALSPGSWTANQVLTVHPGIRTQGADAGRGLAGVGNGLAGGPSVKVDVDRHRGAGEDQEPDDGQDVGNAHKLQGAGQTGAEPWLLSGQGQGQGSARVPRQERMWGRQGTGMLPASSFTLPTKPSVSPSSQHGATARARQPCRSQGQHQPQARGHLCVRGGDRQQQQDGCHIPYRGGKMWPWPSRVWPLREGSCKTCLGVQMWLSCPPSTVPPRLAPKGTAAIPLHSPRPWAPLASTLLWSPSTVERTTPGAPGAGEPWAASTAGMLMALLTDA